jgi:four helix bundle protein
MEKFQKLKVWEQSHILTLEIYRLTKSYPSEEKFGLVTQMRRSASSIPTNIAEGTKRKTDKDTINFLNIAQASLEELKYQIILSRDLEYIDSNLAGNLLGQSREIGAMLNGLTNSLRL